MSVILGWILVILGVLTYAVGFIVSVIVYLKSAQAGGRAFPTAADLKAVAEVLDKLADVLDKFGKLTIPVQWALLGMINIAVGTYLLVNKPF